MLTLLKMFPSLRATLSLKGTLRRGILGLVRVATMIGREKRVGLGMKWGLFRLEEEGPRVEK